MQPPSPEDVRAYYQTALAALRFVEMRKPTGRRFGPEADARWSSLKGDLATSDRIDLLLRDADVEWPGAFGARTTFSLPGVAEDDAFGASWVPLDTVKAEELWRAESCAVSEVQNVLHQWELAWSSPIPKFEVGDISSMDSLVLVGASAIAGAIQTFHGRTDLSWPVQAHCVVVTPAERQLAFLGAAILNVNIASTLVWDRKRPLPKAFRIINSPDANPDVLAEVNNAHGEKS